MGELVDHHWPVLRPAHRDDAVVRGEVAELDLKRRSDGSIEIDPAGMQSTNRMMRDGPDVARAERDTKATRIGMPVQPGLSLDMVPEEFGESAAVVVTRA